MNTRTQTQPRRAPLLLAALAIATICTLAGCSGAGQSQVTESDRPSEGEGWAVQEQMAR